MTAALVMIGGLLAGAAVWLVATGMTPTAPPLGQLVAHLHRDSKSGPVPAGLVGRFGRVAVRLGVARHLASPRIAKTLGLLDRPVEVHAAYVTAGAFGGFLVPVSFSTLLRLVGLNPTPLVASVVVGLVGASVGVLVVHLDAAQRAEGVSTDLRHQLSAYLNVLTMLLAANHGNEGALKLAAEAGDGRLFVELRRRITESSTAGRPTITALAALGRDLGLVELVEIAASASLATSQGAAVSRSLAAKTETLRAALQTEAEQEARLRTGRIAFPLVAMGLVFMVIGLYPALSSIHQGT